MIRLDDSRPYRPHAPRVGLYGYVPRPDLGIARYVLALFIMGGALAGVALGVYPVVDANTGARAIGEVLVSRSFITGYEVSPWTRTLRVGVDSLLPGDARAVASVVCAAAPARTPNLTGWTVEAYLASNSRFPAAACRVGSQ